MPVVILFAEFAKNSSNLCTNLTVFSHVQCVSLYLMCMYVYVFWFYHFYMRNNKHHAGVPKGQSREIFTPGFSSSCSFFTFDWCFKRNLIFPPNSRSSYFLIKFFFEKAFNFSLSFIYYVHTYIMINWRGKNYSPRFENNSYYKFLNFVW